MKKINKKFSFVNKIKLNFLVKLHSIRLSYSINKFECE